MSSQVPSLGDVPYHPPKNFKFPRDESSGRAAQIQWFNDFEWLHYENDKIFCFHCAKAYQQKKLLSSKRMEMTFINVGFNQWKNGLRNFKKHAESDCHKEAIEKLITLPSVTRDVGEILSEQHSREKEKNREYLKKIVASIR